jgi:hypothetical protein
MHTKKKKKKPKRVDVWGGGGWKWCNYSKNLFERWWPDHSHPFSFSFFNNKEKKEWYDMAYKLFM